MTDAVSTRTGSVPAVAKLLPVLVPTAIGTRALFVLMCGARPRKVMVEFFGSRFDGPSGTAFGLLFTGTDAVLGYGLARSRTAPGRVAGWLLAGAGIDFLHTVLAATNRDFSPTRRRATAALIGGFVMTGIAMARAAAQQAAAQPATEK
ncbi:MAG TPA: hypothetical protein VHX38_31170 [Pseudonocardiaceae bacterium]|jgi:hypothetical protein|nr:hypothetical protein [Pseudonocardiaceae bacterium]